MTWENSRRGDRKADNRRRYHQGRVDQARTSKERLWAACSWLVVEAWKTGVLDEAVDHVLTYIHDLRAKEEHRDHDYAA